MPFYTKFSPYASVMLAPGKNQPPGSRAQQKKSASHRSQHYLSVGPEHLITSESALFHSLTVMVLLEAAGGRAARQTASIAHPLGAQKGGQNSSIALDQTGYGGILRAH